MFSFEAGRRCQSGPGNFTFETSQGHEIFQKVESSIRAQQGSENRLSCPTLDTETPTDNTSLGSDSGGSDIQARKDAEEKLLKGRALPNLPSPKPVQSQHLLEPSSVSVITGKTNTPPRSPVSRSVSCFSGNADHLQVYSEPKDSVKGFNPHFDPLYSDPVDSVAGQDARLHKEKSAASPLYSDLYEHAGYEVVGGSNTTQPKLPKSHEEHIYDEPEGMAKTSGPSQLYSEVHTEAAAWRKQADDEKMGYEFPYNPNSDDYSVPNFPSKRSQPRKIAGPKPIPAPKPQGKLILKPAGKEDDAERVPTQCVQSNNNNNNGNTEAIYSQVIKIGSVENKEAKPKPSPPLPPKPQTTPPLPMTGKSHVLPSTSNNLQPGTPPNNSQPEHMDNKRSGPQSAPGKEVSADLIYEDMGVL
ncbi:hypothetical protein GDO81_021982 [Engystomops pustulosus]|uniref:IRS-type PTB domain-containing protein n=1 Tax=Engystomops pustulosus TaxID=76066 RepID=A0AAV6Z6G4_ENGPU|nr:hypothetical protein GDO81_021982 [Engystomops pustulosus]